MNLRCWAVLIICFALLSTGCALTQHTWKPLLAPANTNNSDLNCVTSLRIVTMSTGHIDGPDIATFAFMMVIGSQHPLLNPDSIDPNMLRGVSTGSGLLLPHRRMGWTITTFTEDSKWAGTTGMPLWVKLPNNYLMNDLTSTLAEICGPARVVNVLEFVRRYQALDDKRKLEELEDEELAEYEEMVNFANALNLWELIKEADSVSPDKKIVFLEAKTFQQEPSDTQEPTL